MTANTIKDCDYYLRGKSKTFYKGDEFYEVMKWIMEQVQTAPEGKNGCVVKMKYCINVKVMSENKIYKQKRSAR